MSPERAEGELGWVLERMPHQPPMRLLDEVVAADAMSIVCAATIGEGHVLLDGRGEVSPIVAIELFAQAAAAWMVYRYSGQQGEAFGGYLLGTRKLELFAPGFVVGDALRVEARQVWGTGPLAQFDGRLFSRR